MGDFKVTGALHAGVTMGEGTEDAAAYAGAELGSSVGIGVETDDYELLFMPTALTTISSPVVSAAKLMLDVLVRPSRDGVGIVVGSGVAIERDSDAIPSERGRVVAHTHMGADIILAETKNDLFAFSLSVRPDLGVSVSSEGVGFSLGLGLVGDVDFAQPVRWLVGALGKL